MRTYLLLLAVTATGCHWALNEPGTDPEPAQLYFPTGIVVDPSHRFAYITNGNADLRYGGGTVQMIDLLRAECAISTLRSHFNLSPIPLPADCAAHGPGSGDDWSGDTDAPNYKWCQLDPVDPTIVDCDETPFIVENQTVKVGNFAGDIAMALDPPNLKPLDPMDTEVDSTLHRRLFISVRGDPSVTYIDVNLPPAVIPTSQFAVAPSASRALNCFDSSNALGMANGIDAKTKVVTSPPGCDSDFLVQRDRCDSYPFCLSGKDGQGESQLPTEPFGMRIDSKTTTTTDPMTGLPQTSYVYDRLLVSSLNSGQVSILDINGFPRLTGSSPAFFVPNSQGQHGAFALAARNPGDPSSLWYLSSNIASSLDTFHVAAADLIVPGDSIPFNTTFVLGDDFRAIEFDPTGDRAFITGNAPPTLITLDTHIEASPGGSQPANVISSVIDVCQTPSHMKIRRLLAAGAPGTSTLIKTAVMVVCFLSSQIMMVDPDGVGVTDTIFSGFGGPNQLDVNFGNFDDTPPPPTVWDVNLPWRGYVTNYLESTLAVVDLDPGSPTYNHVIGRIGNPPTGPQSTGPTRKVPPDNTN